VNTRPDFFLSAALMMTATNTVAPHRSCTHDGAPAKTVSALAQLQRVADYRTVVSYNRWAHIDGWSASTVDLVAANERTMEME
jgi:hypothetical protein